MLNIVMRVNQKTTVTANPKDVGNNPTTVHAGPTWSKDNSLVSLNPPTGDSPTCEITSGSELGVTNCVISGQGVPFGPTIHTPFTVTVIAGPLDHFDPTNTPPEPVTPPSPPPA